MNVCDECATPESVYTLRIKFMYQGVEYDESGQYCMDCSREIRKDFTAKMVQRKIDSFNKYAALRAWKKKRENENVKQ